MDEAEVWSRVTEGTREPGAPGPSTVHGELERLLGELRGLQDSLERLGLAQSARTVAAQRRTLTALFVYLTGRQPRPRRDPPPDRRQSRAQHLREALAQTERVAGRLEALANRSTGETRAVLLEQSRKSQSLFRQLLGQLSPGPGRAGG